MGKRKNWEHVGELVSKCKELWLTLKEGAERFGVSVWQLYEYNKRQNRAAKLLQMHRSAGTGAAAAAFYRLAVASRSDYSTEGCSESELRTTP